MEVYSSKEYHIITLRIRKDCGYLLLSIDDRKSGKEGCVPCKNYDSMLSLIAS